MRKIIYSAIVAAAAVVLASCSKAELNKESAVARLQFEASTDSDIVKTTLNGTQVLWEENESISVFSAADYANAKFDMSSLSADKTSATFTGEAAEASSYMALYPYTKGAAASEGTITGVVIPLTQVVAEAGFTSNSNPSVALTSSSSMTFKNLGALVSFRINEDDIDWVELTADTEIAGTGNVTFDGEAPVFTITKGSKSIMLTGNFENGREYCAVVAPAGISSLSFVFHKRAQAATLTSTLAQEREFVRNGNYFVADFQIPSSKWVKGIYDAADLEDFGEKVTAGEDYSQYKDAGGVVNMWHDVDLKNVTHTKSIVAHVKFNQNSNIYSFTTSGNAFKGVFDGHNHTVKGMNINKGLASTDHMYSFSLFGGLDNATVKNLNVSGTGVYAQATNIKTSLAGIAGVAVSSTIENCTVSCERIKGRLVKTNTTNHRYAIAGIVGIGNDVVVKNCINNTRVGLLNGKDDGTSYTNNNGADGGQIGGICGFASGNGKCEFLDCVNNGQIGGYEGSKKTPIGGGTRIAGIAATVFKATDIIRCVNNGEVNGTNLYASDKSCYVAGIVGVTYVAQTNITDCENNGLVTFSISDASYKGTPGGIVSRPLNAAIPITGCKNYGTITSNYFGDGETVNNGVGLIIAKPITIGATVKDCIIGGKIGPLDEAKQITITEENYEKFITGDWTNKSYVTIENCSFGTK